MPATLRTRFVFLPLPALAASTLLATLPGQNDRVRALADQAVTALGDPARCRDAMRQLVHLGAAALPALTAGLVARPDDPDDDLRRSSIAAVLARLGRPATAALPDLLRLVERDTSQRGPAAWALSGLVPFLDEDRCRQIESVLEPLYNARFVDAPVWTLQSAVALGPAPTAEALQRSLGSGGNDTIAACQWLATRGHELTDSRADVLAVVERELANAMARPAIRWTTGPQPAAPLLAGAWLTLTAQAPDATCARALLEHWDADERERGVAWLRESGATLPLRERADLVGRLWDADAGIARAAASAFGAWGLAGLVALPALRRQAADHDDLAVTAACRAAADAIVAAAEGLPPTDRAWLAACDATLCGRPATSPDKPCTKAGLTRLGELLYLAQWNDPATLARLLSLGESAGMPTPDAVRAVLGWLAHDDPRVVELACAWLARRGAAVRSAFGTGDGTGFDDYGAFLRYACQGLRGSAVRSGIELLAHQLAEGAWDERQARLLDDGNSRVVAHALATALVERRGTLRPDSERLRALLEPPAAPTMRIVAAAWDTRTLPVDLGHHVRTLAALALSDLGVPFTAPADLDDVVRQTLGLSLAELPRHVADLRETNRLPALLDRIEDQCRLLLAVPPHLRWPSLAGTTR